MPLRWRTCRLSLAGRQVLASGIFTLAITALLLWSFPAITSALWGLKVPSDQPDFHIPLDTSSVERALVIPKTRHDDIRWVGGLDAIPGTTAFVYSTDVWPEARYLRPRSRKGREVAAYLSFVLDYYDALPKYALFVHAAEDQWHNDILSKYSNQPDTIRNFRTAAVDAHGFVNLRCRLSPSCPVAVHPLDAMDLDMKVQDPRSYADIYQEIFDVAPNEVPETIGAVCCAQFAVSRERIRQRPRADYERFLAWADETSWTDSFGVGLLYEKLWHIIFGMAAVHCPRYEQCRCDNFGWCGPLHSGEMLIPAVGEGSQSANQTVH